MNKTTILTMLTLLIVSACDTDEQQLRGYCETDPEPEVRIWNGVDTEVVPACACIDDSTKAGFTGMCEGAATCALCCASMDATWQGCEWADPAHFPGC